jgi:addiction module RelE/StbE family toxin
MAKINLSPAALNDLKSIFDYISSDSVFYAEKVIDKILKKITILESNNRIGKKVREFDNESIRELLEGNYRIIYRIENEDEISVVRIFHGARLLKSL